MKSFTLLSLFILS
ncbi:putative exported protein, partial [Yersinia pestis PY-103]